MKELKLQDVIQDILEEVLSNLDIIHFENGSLDNLFDKGVENEVLWL